MYLAMYPVNLDAETVAWFRSEAAAVAFGAQLTLDYPALPVEVFGRARQDGTRQLVAEFFPRHNLEV